MPIDMPDMLNAILLQKLVHILTDFDQTIFVPAGDP